MMKKLAILRDEQGADGGESGSGTEEKGRKITMDDGRVLVFGEKQKMKKDYGTKDENVWARIDFDNGKSVEVLLKAGSLAAEAAGGDKHAQVSLDLMGHGTVQKLGDSASGAETTDDALEAVLEVATRLNNGEFSKAREGGGGSAKGASELVLALVEVLEKSRDEVRAMLGALTPADKMALRRVDEVAKAIERQREARKPSKGEQEKAAKASELLSAMKTGTLQVPVPAEAPTA